MVDQQADISQAPNYDVLLTTHVESLQPQEASRNIIYIPLRNVLFKFHGFDLGLLRDSWDN